MNGISDDALAAVVEKRTGDPKHLGTAFHVGAGWLLTAKHVVQKKDKAVEDVWICHRRTDDLLKTSNIVGHPSLDVALLRCESWPGETRLPLANDLPPVEATIEHAAIGCEILKTETETERFPVNPISYQGKNASGQILLGTDSLRRGFSGCPIFESVSGVVWAVFSAIVEPESVLERLERPTPWKYAVATAEFVEFVSSNVGEQDVDVVSLKHVVLRERLRQHHVRLAWHPASSPHHAVRSNLDKPYFAVPARPTETDIARGEGFRLPILDDVRAFLDAPDDRSRWVVVHGEGAKSGKTTAGFRIAREQHEAAIVLVADGLKADLEGALPTALRVAKNSSKRLVILLDRAPAKSDRLLDSLDAILEVACDDFEVRADVILVDPAMSTRFSSAIERKLSTNTAMIIDIAEQSRHVDPREVYSHVSTVWRQHYGMELQGAPPTEFLAHTGMASMLGGFSRMPRQARDSHEARPAWLHDSLVDWIALFSRHDCVLPWPLAFVALSMHDSVLLGGAPPNSLLAMSALDALPAMQSCGSYDEAGICWTPEGLTFDHAELAREYPVTDPASTAIEVLRHVRSFSVEELWPIFQEARDYEALRRHILERLNGAEEDLERHKRYERSAGDLQQRLLLGGGSCVTEVGYQLAVRDNMDQPTPERFALASGGSTLHLLYVGVGVVDQPPRQPQGEEHDLFARVLLCERSAAAFFVDSPDVTLNDRALSALEAVPSSHRGAVRLWGAELHASTHELSIKRLGSHDMPFEWRVSPNDVKNVERGVLTIECDDVIVIGSSRILRVANGFGEEYRKARLQRLLKRHWADDAQAISTAIVDNVMAWGGLRTWPQGHSFVVIRRLACDRAAPTR